MSSVKAKRCVLVLIVIMYVLFSLGFSNSEEPVGEEPLKPGTHENVVVEVFAGSGEFKFEEGEALKAGFRYPYGLAVDKDGGLLVADSFNHAVRKIVDGSVKTIAGGYDEGMLDTYGFPVGGYVDGRKAASRFNRPRGIAINSKGVIYITDTENHSIRKIEGDKVVTWAGSGSAGYRNGKGNTAEFCFPTGIAIDKFDNIYVADTLNNCIRKISPNGIVTLFAGKPGDEGGYKDGWLFEAMFNEPTGLAFDNEGNLYIADSGNQVIRKISGSMVSTYAGVVNENEKIAETGYYKGGYRDGNRETALFNFPKGLAVTGNGTVVVADTWNNRIRAVKPDGEVITIAGTGEPGEVTGPAGKAMFSDPVDVVYCSGFLYISDMWNNTIKRMPFDEENPIQINIPDIDEIQFEPYSENIQVWIDGIKVEFPDVKPFTEDGVQFVPVRFVFETWGAEVDWEQETKTVIIKKEYKVALIHTNEEPVVFKNDRTMVSTQYMSEKFGFSVEWIPEYNAVVFVTQ